MGLADYTKFANDNPICYLATCDGDQPRVRGMMLWYADDTGFYFHTGAPKAVTEQIRRNPKIEVCFFAPGESQLESVMMRVAGEVEFLDDRALKERLLEERPFLKAIGAGTPDDPTLCVFRITHGEVHFWTIMNNLNESAIERVRF